MDVAIIVLLMWLLLHQSHTSFKLFCSFVSVSRYSLLSHMCLIGQVVYAWCHLNCALLITQLSEVMLFLLMLGQFAFLAIRQKFVLQHWVFVHNQLHLRCLFILIIFELVFIVLQLQILIASDYCWHQIAWNYWTVFIRKFALILTVLVLVRGWYVAYSEHG